MIQYLRRGYYNNKHEYFQLISSLIENIKIFKQETVARYVCSLLASELIASINVRRLSRKALFARLPPPTTRCTLRRCKQLQLTPTATQLSLLVDRPPKCYPIRLVKVITKIQSWWVMVVERSPYAHAIYISHAEITL